MQLDYIRNPQLLIQQDLFEPASVYTKIDIPLFFDTLIRWQFNENIWYLASQDLSYLLVSGYGVKLSKKSERLVIKENSKSVYELPFFRLKNVAVLSKGVGLSSDLIQEFSEADIALSFHDFSGKPIALLQSIDAPYHADLKRKQIFFQNSKAGISLIADIVAGKIANQIALLKYAVKNLQPDTSINQLKLQTVANACRQMETNIAQCKKIYSLLLDKDFIFDEIRSQLMGYEGTSARIYWQAISVLLSSKLEFAGRLTKKIPKDAVNPLLNYGYGILYAKIWSAIILAGLDPYLGFLHTEQSGKPSLVFDLIEEFRAPIVDRTVIAFIMLNRNITITNGLLDLDTRQKFSEKILETLTCAQYYEGQKIMFSDIILSQARKIVAVLEGRAKQYDAFKLKW
jgi:CRISPR-associated protein Cas1